MTEIAAKFQQDTSLATLPDIRNNETVRALGKIQEDIDTIIEIGNEKKSSHLKFVGRSIEKILKAKSGENCLKDFINETKTKKTLGKQLRIPISEIERSRANQLLQNISKNLDIITRQNEPSYFFNQKVNSAITITEIFKTTKIEELHKQKASLFAFFETELWPTPKTK